MLVVIALICGGWYWWHQHSPAPAVTVPAAQAVEQSPAQKLEQEIAKLQTEWQATASPIVLAKLELASSLLKADKVAEATEQVAIAKMIVDGTTAPARQATIPIIMYHKTPSNFAQQLAHLQSRGYTTITMLHAGDYLRGYRADIPAKPVVLTFDDGFEDNLQAAKTLSAANLCGTFYLILGGELSRYCIGPERNRTDCGDTYMSWAQLRELAAQPAVEVGVHTVDHANLASLTAVQQEWQIKTTQQRLLQETGQYSTSLAYPYGQYTQTTVEVATRLGLETAVTTVAGTSQNGNKPYELRRVRNALELP